MIESSRRFDRAASFYDRTRALPDDAMAELVDRLVVELADRAPALEIGVGTGRIALPLHAAGITMAGVDLSRPMMDVLVDKAGGRPPFPLSLADATALPFASDRFGAAVASHVFHLIPNWRDAVDELVRVVRAGGVVLSSGRERDDGSPVALVEQRFRAETGVTRAHIGARHDGTEVAEAFAQHGAQERVLPPIGIRRAVTVGTMLDMLESKQWSWTWSLPDDVVHRTAAATRAWAEREIGPLDAEHVIETQVAFRAYDLPA
jgi:ubiquinone/menaquinone biosynthesis C-methylase UbiE